MKTTFSSKTIYKMVILTTLFFSYFISQSQTKAEITKYDITKLPNFSSDKISVFNIYLGMTMDAVRTSLLNNQSIMMATNSKVPTAIAIYDRKADGKVNKLLINLKWDDPSGGLKEIKMNEDFAPYLQGNTAKLVTLEAINKQSEVYRTFLIKPELVENQDYRQFLNLYSTIYHYKKKGIIIEHQKIDEKNIIEFTLIAK